MKPEAVIVGVFDMHVPKGERLLDWIYVMGVSCKVTACEKGYVGDDVVRNLESRRYTVEARDFTDRFRRLGIDERRDFVVEHKHLESDRAAYGHARIVVPRDLGFCV